MTAKKKSTIKNNLMYMVLATFTLAGRGGGVEWGHEKPIDLR